MRLFRLVAWIPLFFLPAAMAANITVPQAHPRLWYGDAARLAQARTYFTSHPILPGASDFFEKALDGVINGNTANCTAAAHYFRDWQASVGPGGFRDDVRQQGEELLLMFDWCYASLTAPEVSALVSRWNGYMDRGLADDLGNAGKEANNYWAGYTRNLLLWGIASYHVNARAQEFIDIALDQRYGQQLSTWYAKFGQGGVFPEGGDYGVVSLSYPLLGVASARDFGFDVYAHTPYFREALYALLYGVTPGPSSVTGQVQGQYSLFPWNDDEHFYEGGAINTRNYLGDFVTYAARYYAGKDNALHALGWIAAAQPHRDALFEAFAQGLGGGTLAGLPLDYYAPGAAYADFRTRHDAGPGNMQVHLQLGTPGGIEHRHLDGGSFQVWRNGQWLTRESTGYADVVAAFGGSGDTDSSDPAAHNTLLFEGRSTGIWIGGGPEPVPPGTPPSDQPRGLPRVARLQHENAFAFVAADYSDAYRNGLDTRVDWPYADQAWREFLFLRPLQALVILDRVRGSSDSQRAFYFTPDWLESGPHVSGAQVRRTFVMHFETPPAANGASRLAATVGTQKSELITLLPANPYGAASPAVRIFNEDRPGDEMAGQYRLELDTSGSTDAYFLNLVTGYDAGEAALTATLTDLGDRWSLALSQPTRGSAVVVLRKGMTSSGGSVQLDGGAVVPLSESVQGIVVTDHGPEWLTDRIFANGFE